MSIQKYDADEQRNAAEYAASFMSGNTNNNVNRYAEIEADLIRATSIGISVILVKCGSYITLNPYLKARVDELISLRRKVEKYPTNR